MVSVVLAKIVLQMHLPVPITNAMNQHAPVAVVSRLYPMVGLMSHASVIRVVQVRIVIVMALEAVYQERQLIVIQHVKDWIVHQEVVGVV